MVPPGAGVLPAVVVAAVVAEVSLALTCGVDRVELPKFSERADTVALWVAPDESYTRTHKYTHSLLCMAQSSNYYWKLPW